MLGSISDASWNWNLFHQKADNVTPKDFDMYLQKMIRDGMRMAGYYIFEKAAWIKENFNTVFFREQNQHSILSNNIKEHAY